MRRVLSSVLDKLLLKTRTPKKTKKEVAEARIVEGDEEDEGAKEEKCEGLFSERQHLCPLPSFLLRWVQSDCGCTTEPEANAQPLELLPVFSASPASVRFREGQERGGG